MPNPDKITIREPIDAPGESLTWDGQNVEVMRGARCASLTVTNGTLRLSGELDVGQVVLVRPQTQGAPDQGLRFAGASGIVDAAIVLGCLRDHGRIGQETHDLWIDLWYSRSDDPGVEDLVPGAPGNPHRDGIQIISAFRVTIGRVDIVNAYPGSTNGGIFINPSTHDAPADLIQDVVIGGGQITFPNYGVHLGNCTRCGVRNTILVAKRPFATGDQTIEPLDEQNTKIASPGS
jgi:hypothetical protein